MENQEQLPNQLEGDVQPEIEETTEPPNTLGITVADSVTSADRFGG